MNGRKRIAIYGGTFDPVHLGHMEVARRVSELFEIDELLFVPAQVAPHKLTRPVTPAIHRYAMLALATQEESRLLVSTFELEARIAVTRWIRWRISRRSLASPRTCFS